MTTFDPKKNFAVSSVVVAPSPALTGNTLQVAAGEGSLFPATGAGVSWNAIVFPANAAPSVSNAEIVRVTNRVGEVFTITRQQEGSQGRSIQVGDRIMNGFTVKTFTDIEAAILAAGGATVLSAAPVLEPGVAGQVRAGRVLGVNDFATLLGLSTPAGLFNLGDLSNLGFGGALTNKGAVAFGGGIMGAATEAALFTGSTAQALYIVDTGAADPFRISYGSVGCWFRTAKRATQQTLVSKEDAGGTGAGSVFMLDARSSNTVEIQLNVAAGAIQAIGTSDVCDDRWHFAVGTWDGAVGSIYVDGVLEGVVSGAGPLNATVAPLNIGGHGATAVANAVEPFYGRIDEAFVTSDVLSADQVRFLYATEVAHALGSVPLSAKLAVRRQRHSGAIPAGSFSTQPLHLYNFTGGALSDQGSLGTPLTNNGATLAAPGVDGVQGNAFNYVGASSQSLSASDAGLPATNAARSMGCWFKTTAAANQTFVGYGTAAADTAFELSITAAGLVQLDTWTTARAQTTIPYNDGQWHFAVATYDDAALDGLRTKLYIDGKLVATGTASISTTLAGANKFRVGSTPSPTQFLTGQADAAFVTGYAMSADEVAKVYAVGSLSLGVSPKDAGAHVEAMDAASVYLIADTLESQHLLDLEVTG